MSETESMSRDAFDRLMHTMLANNIGMTEEQARAKLLADGKRCVDDVDAESTVALGAPAPKFVE